MLSQCTTLAYYANPISKWGNVIFECFERTRVYWVNESPNVPSLYDKYSARDWIESVGVYIGSDYD